MVQIIEQAPDIFGRIGKGLAEGLEGVPKIIQRRNTANALENYQKLNVDNPMKLAADLLRSNNDIQEIAPLIPLFRQLQSNSIYSKKGNDVKNLPSKELKKENLDTNIEKLPLRNETSNQITPEQEKEKISGISPVREAVIKGFASPEKLREMNRNLFRPATREEIEQRIDESTRKGLNRQEAEIEAQEKLNAPYHTQQGNIEKGQESFERRLNTRFGESLQRMPIPGSLMKAFNDEIKSRIVDGENPNLVGVDVAERAIRVKENLDQANTTAKKWLIGQFPKKMMSQLKNQRKVFEDYGQRFTEIFDDAVEAASGLSPLTVAEELNPIKESNKDIFNKIKKFNPVYQYVDKKIDGLFDSILKSISEDDNMMSIMSELMKKGINIEKFKNYILLNEKNFGHLTRTQEKQLTKPIPSHDYGQILFKSMKEFGL